jgi:hypothetical protein
MRLSARDDSPFYTPEILDVEGVLIDGVLHLDAVEACEEEGWADVLVRGPDGQFVVQGDDIVTERVHGAVKIVLRRSA